MVRTNNHSRSKGWKVVIALIVAVAGVAIAWINSRRPIDAAQSQPGERPVPPKGTLKITSLSSGGQVVPEPVVEGDASGSIEQVWLLIQTRQMPPICWIQGPSGLDENRKWHIPALFGRSWSLDSGARFSVSAIAGPPNDTKPGVVSCTLPAAVRSPSVEVTRQ